MSASPERISSESPIQAIGRPAVSANVFDAIDAIKAIEDDNFKLETLDNPALDYFHTSWLADLAINGIARSDPRLAVPETSNLPELIKSPEDLLAALYTSRHIDQEQAVAYLSLKFLRLRFKTKTKDARIMHIDAALIDEYNPRYAQQETTIRGEQAVTGRLKYPDYKVHPLDPGQIVPTVYVPLARITFGIFAAAKIATRKAALPHFKDTKVDLAPIGPIDAR